jgi:hypothetical protein
MAVCRSPPGPWLWPLIGDTAKLITEKNGQRYNVERHRQYGDIYRTNLFLTHMVAVSNEAEVKRLLKGEHVLAKGMNTANWQCA